MPHTIARALSEVALLGHSQDLQWTMIGDLTGRAASQQLDAAGREVYASIYFVDVFGFPAAGLGVFGPDDDLEVVSTLGRYGPSMLDAEHRLYRSTALPPVLPDALPPAPTVRLSNVLVGMVDGPDDLRVTTPANATIDGIPSLSAEPDSYRLIKQAQREGRFFEAPADARVLVAEAPPLIQPINPDRDLNGVGLLYFANYVAFMNLAERAALETRAGFAPEALDRRVTLRRRIGFYGNARPHDHLAIEVDIFEIAVGRLLVHHRIRRRSDDRLIAVASAERQLRSG